MTAFDKFLPKRLIIFLDILSDIAVLVLAVVMIVVGWKYSVQIGSRGSYVVCSMFLDLDVLSYSSGRYSYVYFPNRGFIR